MSSPPPPSLRPPTSGSAVYASCGDAAPLCIVADHSARRLSLAGELDLSTRPLVSSAAEGVLTAGAGGLTIDLARLSFLDASGLAVLLGLRDRVVGAGQPFVLRHPPALVRRIFLLAGLGRLLPGAETASFVPAAAGRAEESCPA